MAKLSSKRLRLDDKHISSDEPGPRGLTYDETSLVYSLLWNQPSLYPSQSSYSLRHTNPLVRRGGQAVVKTTSVGLPVFYTDQPPSEEEEEEEEEEAERQEIREVSPSVVQRVTPWCRQGRRSLDHIPPSTEADIASRVRSVLGYEFPPIMSRMLEDSVRRKWLKWKENGMVSTESSEKESRLYLQLVVDTHVFMATEVERRLLLADSPDHSHEGSEDTEDET